MPRNQLQSRHHWKLHWIIEGVSRLEVLYQLNNRQVLFITRFWAKLPFRISLITFFLHTALGIRQSIHMPNLFTAWTISLNPTSTWRSIFCMVMSSIVRSWDLPTWCTWTIAIVWATVGSYQPILSLSDPSTWMHPYPSTFPPELTFGLEDRKVLGSWNLWWYSW